MLVGELLGSIYSPLRELQIQLLRHPDHTIDRCRSPYVCGVLVEKIDKSGCNMTMGYVRQVVYPTLFQSLV
jgi:hypothetical protein